MIKSRQYRLLKWYPSLSKELKEGDILEYGFGIYRKNVNGKYIGVLPYEVENNPEFWEEIIEKNYQNIIFKCKIDDYEWQQFGDNNLMNKHGVHIPYDPKIHYIHSIELLPSKQRYTVEDNVQYINDSKINNKIKEFFFKNDKILFNFVDDNYDGGYYLELLNSYIVVKPLFTTEDGVDIYEGDKTWAVDTLEMCLYDEVPRLYNGRTSSFVYFSSKKIAEKWIEENKPRYTKQDVRKALEVFTNNAQFHKEKFWEILNKDK